MSTFLINASRGPLNRGIPFDANETDSVNRWRYLAYHHPDNMLVYFATESVEGKTVTHNGHIFHDDLFSSSRFLPLPLLADQNVWHISREEFDRLVMLENEWWEDHQEWLDTHPGDERGAASFANAETVRLGR